MATRTFDADKEALESLILLQRGFIDGELAATGRRGADETTEGELVLSAC